jgi:hypothetical protein
MLDNWGQYVGALDAAEEVERAGLVVKYSSGNITAEEKARLAELLEEQLGQALSTIKANSKNLKSDGRVIWLPLAAGMPVPVPISLLADMAAAGSSSAESVIKIYNAVGPAKGIKTAAGILGWAGEHPYLALGIAGAVVGTVLIGPAVVQLLPMLLLKRKV